jgi:DNA (cytosine-5)-methyltransferase 1
MTGFSRLSRFGMTYKPLEENLGEELLTLYLAAFHAPTFPQQEKEQELMEKPLECGEKWRGSFTKYDPNLSLWKTHQCSLLGDLEEFLEIWPQWGLMRNGECWEQRTLEQTIRGIGYGLSPNGVDSFHTPNTTGLDGGSNSRKALKKRMEMWPTPATKGYGHAAEGMVGNLMTKIERGILTKHEAEQMLSLPKLENHRTWKKKFPTPQLSDYKDRGNMSNPSIQRRAKKGKQMTLSMVAHPTSGQLNPMWVEWLMGWPLGWTDLKPLVMDKSPCVPQPLGES